MLNRTYALCVYLSQVICVNFCVFEFIKCGEWLREINFFSCNRGVFNYFIFLWLKFLISNHLRVAVLINDVLFVF